MCSAAKEASGEDEPASESTAPCPAVALLEPAEDKKSTFPTLIVKFKRIRCDSVDPVEEMVCMRL